MIYDELNEITMTNEEKLSRRNTMVSTTILADTLKNISIADEVLRLLYVELSGAARPSAVTRIFGRYSALSRMDDWNSLFRWRAEWEKRKQL